MITERMQQLAGVIQESSHMDYKVGDYVIDSGGDMGVVLKVSAGKYQIYWTKMHGHKTGGVGNHLKNSLEGSRMATRSEQRQIEKDYRKQSQPQRLSGIAAHDARRGLTRGPGVTS